MISQAQCKMMKIPLELLQAIVDRLDLPAILFVTVYRQHLCGGASCIRHLDKQHASYYGDNRNVADAPASTALLNWSSTCR
jgi:hypothetical protein